MPKANVDELKKKFTDQYVTADASVAELARFAGKAGRVVTVNENGVALVDFEDGPWYDIPLDHLTVTTKPEPKPAAHAEKKAPAKGKSAEAEG